ncbi:MAG: rRNA pseudouridine synthase [Clostridium sp.]|nr:rRNA pseudouridine synthase [Clostridium sp.]MBO6150571.1 rRNA pseudouridine synthase [Clostridium sp.]
MRLDKFLADMGVGKRSDIRKEIRAGRVSVGREILRDPGAHVSEQDEIIYRGKPVRYETFVYYMLNKPAGVITATEDRHQETVLDLIGEQKRKDLFPVGRLDRDTEGLLLITNDGDLGHRLLSPRHHVDKTYLVQTDLPVTEEDVRVFAGGFQVDEELTAMPADLVLLGEMGPEWAEITIREGKFHQIKRMFQARGKTVVYLKRISMGTLVLDESLLPGSYRRLTEEELGALLALTGREQSD